MPTSRRSSPSAICAALLALLGCIAIALLPARSSVARAASVGRLQQQIGAGQNRISSLSGVVSAASDRLSQLNSSIAGLENRIAQIQANLNADRTKLLKLRDELAAARSRLAQLEAFEAHAESVLAKQLVNGYESDSPDLVTVVLESRGFKDLLERLAFARRIRTQDVQVVSQVRAARRAVADQATRLGALSVRQQALTAAVLEQRNSLGQTRVSLVQQQLAVAEYRSRKANQLSSVRGQVASLKHQLSQIEAAQAAAAAAAAAARARQLAAASAPPASSGSSGSSGASGSSGSAGSGSAVGAPQLSSGGGFIFPMPKGAASPPGTWSLDQGVDISAPGGTSEVAVCSGTIVLHGIGGFGPWAPVLHCDSPLSGGGYVYYGHAGPANQLPVGTHVSAGQVMSEVGPGIVGISSGPHIEIGFCDSSGTPIGGGSASAMMSLLQAAYGG